MSLCISGITMSALIAGLVIMDAYTLNDEHIPTHLILGGLLIALFFALCRYGYEMVNWVLLLLIPSYLLLSFIFSISFTTNTNTPKCHNKCNRRTTNKKECKPKPIPKPIQKPSCK